MAVSESVCADYAALGDVAVSQRRRERSSQFRMHRHDSCLPALARPDSNRVQFGIEREVRGFEGVSRMLNEISADSCYRRKAPIGAGTNFRLSIAEE